jgi:hypothetical protein
MTGTDRLFPRPITLTDDERERARVAFAETPTLLDAPIMAALAHIEHGERLADAIIDRVRGVAP